MLSDSRAVLFSLVGLLALLVLASACRTAPGPSDAAVEIPSAREPNAAVSGTITYRELIALTPGARLIVELRDVSLADAPAPLIARQVIANPGQVPIEFKIAYSRDDIDPRNSYAIQASIIEAGGRLAFINDTAYEVITRGNPSSVDMLLVLVKTPPGQGEKEPDGQAWVEVLAPVVHAHPIGDESGRFLRVVYYQSASAECARPGSEELQVDGYDIVVRLTLMQPATFSESASCREAVVKREAMLPIGAPLAPERTYRVIVNDLIVAAFTLPRPGLRESIIADSPIESSEVMELAGAPRAYQLRVVSAMPKGSGCSQFNGYEIRRGHPNEIEVRITHHQNTAKDVACTADVPIVETAVPLGSDFAAGTAYTVRVNAGTTVSFVAR